MHRNAVALRAFTHDQTAFAEDQVILGMDAGQFTDWEQAELVRAATEAEVASATSADAAERSPRSTTKALPAGQKSPR